MPACRTSAEFVDCLRKSGLIGPEALDSYLDGLRSGGEWSDDPAALGGRMMADGRLSRFQAQQVLKGRWKDFVLGGKYRVLGRLGNGPMSTVFLCEHTVMRRPVAVKVLPPDHAQDPVIVARFHREARAAARLRHPNVAGIHDVDVDASGQLHFLVAEYVDGSNLEQVVAAAGPLPVARAAHYASQAAEGLQHAHQKGMVHRDIKPSNLVLDRTGTVKLLDLGLARLFQDDADHLTQAEDGRLMLGTIDYLAPEQAADSHDVDIRADIYSLGATLYYLLTGRPLFAGATTIQKLSMHAHRPVGPILGEVPGLPDELAGVIERMLAKSPDDRYQTPAEVIEAMGPWAAGPIRRPSRNEMPRHCPLVRKALEHSDPEPRKVSRPPSPPNRLVPVRPAAASVPEPAPVPAAPRSLARPEASPPTRWRWVGIASAGLALVGLAVLAWVYRPGEAGMAASPAPTAPKGPGPGPATSTPAPARSPRPGPPPDRPGPASALFEAASDLARHGRWREAAEGYHRGLLVDPDGGAIQWSRAAILDLRIGDLDAYRDDCRELLRRFGEATDPAMADRVARACLLGHEPVELDRPRRLAALAAAEAGRGDYGFWYLVGQGIANYRAGDFEGAARQLIAARDRTGEFLSECRGLIQFFLAMSYARLDRPDRARAEFDRGVKAMEGRVPSSERADFGPSWHDWAACQTARREAEALLASRGQGR